MRLRLITCLLGALLLLGCASAPTAVSTNLAVPTVIATTIATTAAQNNDPVVDVATGSPLPTLLPPATHTAVPSMTPVLKVPIDPVAVSTLPAAEPSATFAAYGVPQIIGNSVAGRPLTSYRFGFGTQSVVLVGGMHGGYEWNTILLAYDMIDYFLANPDQVPANVSLYIVPAANPDGQYWVTGRDGRFTAQDVSGDTDPGRFNSNQVDLNRNWACDWQPEGLWGSRAVSGGAVPFSEPETAALRTFFLREQPEAVVLWHSKANGIFVGSCDGSHAPSQEIANVYGRASGYQVFESFTAYPVTGDASDWLTTQNIPSFTVELRTHSSTDWSENLAGVLALLEFYGR